mmetsp:Transcript_21992/g.37598  ORF Transcript_21992/g.37598 Transcript_21992/m.37598 type:complete len:177 (-) Transcript_21992:177-707(-)
MFIRPRVKSSLIHPQPIKPPPVAFIPFLATSLSSPHQPASVDNDNEKIAIGNVDSNVFIEMGRPLYSFSFAIYTISEGRRHLVSQHKIVKSFDELQEIHNELIEELGNCHTLPVFPTTKWLSFSVRLEVLKQRQSFLQEYFTKLLSCKEFLSCINAHRLFCVPSRLSEYLVKLGEQ